MGITLEAKMSFANLHPSWKNKFFFKMFQQNFKKYSCYPGSTFITFEIAYWGIWGTSSFVDDFFQIFINPKHQKCIDGKQIEISRSLLETILKEGIERFKREEKQLELEDMMLMRDIIQTLEKILNDPDLQNCDEFYYTVSY